MENILRVVFQCCLNSLLAQISEKNNFPLMLHTKFFNTIYNYSQGGRVFPSSRRYSASSRRFQFHWACVGDSGTVVTPFMQDTN